MSSEPRAATEFLSSTDADFDVVWAAQSARLRKHIASHPEIRYRCPTPELREDLLHEVYLCARRTWVPAKMTNALAAYSFLLRVTFFVAANMSRKVKGPGNRERPLTSEPPSPGPANPERDAEHWRLTRTFIEEVLYELPPLERRIWFAMRVERYTAPELAEMHNLEESEVRNADRRAQRKIDKKLAAHPELRAARDAFVVVLFAGGGGTVAWKGGLAAALAAAIIFAPTAYYLTRSPAEDARVEIEDERTPEEIDLWWETLSGAPNRFDVPLDAHAITPASGATSSADLFPVWATRLRDVRVDSAGRVLATRTSVPIDFGVSQRTGAHIFTRGEPMSDTARDEIVGMRVDEDRFVIVADSATLLVGRLLPGGRAAVGNAYELLNESAPSTWSPYPPDSGDMRARRVLVSRGAFRVWPEEGCRGDLGPGVWFTDLNAAAIANTAAEQGFSVLGGLWFTPVEVRGGRVHALPGTTVIVARPTQRADGRPELRTVLGFELDGETGGRPVGDDDVVLGWADDRVALAWGEVSERNMLTSAVDACGNP